MLIGQRCVRRGCFPGRSEHHILRNTRGFLFIKHHVRALVKLLNGKLFGSNRPHECRKGDCTGEESDQDDDEGCERNCHETPRVIDSKKADARYKHIGISARKSSIDFPLKESYVLAAMAADLWLSFLTGLAGSLHCVGMCGPIVLAYAAQHLKGNGRSGGAFSSHLAYNFGRVLSYTIVGGIVGFVGGGLHALQGVGVWFSSIAGMIMILFGIGLLRIVPWLHMFSEPPLGQEARNVLFRLYRASFGALVTSPGLESKFSIGLLTPLLPCGLLYSMVVKAASTGSFLSGASTMFFFGLGIVPTLLLTGLVSSYVSQRVRVWGDKIAALTVLLMGVMLIARAMAGGDHTH